MQVDFLAKKKMPYCPGCGHHSSNLNLAKALEKSGLNLLDVVIVSDIGCSGLIDENMACHTVHGLHGRVVALAAGISYALGNNKKVIAIQGDGGATIGMQHLLVAAKRNINMTLLVLNNNVYGMTGGQLSGLSHPDLKEKILHDEAYYPAFDIAQMAHEAGAVYSSKIMAKGEFSEKLLAAIKTVGFSVVEIVGPCPAYGYNSVKEMIDLGYEEIVKTNNREFVAPHYSEKPSLFASKRAASREFTSKVTNRMTILIGGSAGEGVQLAADLLAQAGLYCGLNNTKKGEYPITVGTGFSLAEVIMANDSIYYTGIEKAEVAIVTSQEGWEMVKSRVNEFTKLFVDDTIDTGTVDYGVRLPFREKVGRKSAVLCAIAYWMSHSGMVPVEALVKAFSGHKHEEKLLEAVKTGVEM